MNLPFSETNEMSLMDVHNKFGFVISAKFNNIKLGDMWFQQDGTILHLEDETIQLLRKILKVELIKKQ